MSDGFDKEAEREKLREKFADDEEEREHTQRMSELLLQGATMTNRHCDDCGDPIFRKDGQEFCPTCHTVDAADVEGDGTAAAEQSAAPPAGGESPPATGGNGATDPRRTGRGPAGARSRSAADAPDSSVTETPDRSAEPSGDRAAAGSAPTGSQPAGSAPDAPGDRAAATAADSGSVADARASLARTLNRFAAAAEETDDPRRARDHLRAAREAAEALSALDR